MNALTPIYRHTNSPDRSLYISLEALTEVAGDHFIDSKNLFSIIY